jgi:hypothetical protein
MPAKAGIQSSQTHRMCPATAAGGYWIIRCADDDDRECFPDAIEAGKLPQ